MPGAPGIRRHLLSMTTELISILEAASPHDESAFLLDIRSKLWRFSAVCLLVQILAEFVTQIPPQKRAWHDEEVCHHLTGALEVQSSAMVSAVGAIRV